MAVSLVNQKWPKARFILFTVLNSPELIDSRGRAGERADGHISRKEWFVIK